MTALVVAALINPLSLPLLFVAWPLASRASHRSRTVQRSVQVAIGISLTLGLFGSLTSYAGFDLQGWWEWSGGYAQLAALVLIPVTLLMVGSGMRAGEPPARRDRGLSRRRAARAVPDAGRACRTGDGLRR